MTTDSNASQQRAVAYLKRSLKLNPLYESEKIVRYRSNALGLARTKAAPLSKNNAAKRAKILKKIDEIRAACWTEPVEPQLKQLSSFSLDDQPDLKRTAERLHVILSNRPRLPALAGHKHFDAKFLSCFKQILTLPPRELAVPREQVIASFRNKKLRKRGMRMIALLEQEVPELCQLEQEWLNSLKRQKVNKGILSSSNDYQSSQDHSVGSGDSGGTSWWLVWIIVIAVVRLLSSIARNSD